MGGMIDDSRKLHQDFIAPELKALQEQVKALGVLTRAEFTSLNKTMDVRLSALESAIGSNK
jgi:hypothetical protein